MVASSIILYLLPSPPLLDTMGHTQLTMGHTQHNDVKEEEWLQLSLPSPLLPSSQGHSEPVWCVLCSAQYHRVLQGGGLRGRVPDGQGTAHPETRICVHSGELNNTMQMTNIHNQDIPQNCSTGFIKSTQSAKHYVPVAVINRIPSFCSNNLQ